MGEDECLEVNVQSQTLYAEGRHLGTGRRCAEEWSIDWSSGTVDFGITQLTGPTHLPQGPGALVRCFSLEEIQPSNYLLFSFPASAVPTILIM